MRVESKAIWCLAEAAVGKWDGTGGKADRRRQIGTTFMRRYRLYSAECTVPDSADLGWRCESVSQHQGGDAVMRLVEIPGPSPKVVQQLYVRQKCQNLAD